jgi:hypothetical protein
VEKRRARPARCSAKSIAVAAAVLLSASLLSWPNPAPGAEGAPRDEVASGTSTAVLRGTRPPGPEPAAAARTAARRKEQQRDLGFERTLPYGSGWNNDLNWEGINSEPQIDTIVR